MSRGLAVIAVAALLLVAVAVGFAQDDKPWEKPGTKAGEEIVGPDGGKMVWVPAGEFSMGSDDIVFWDDNTSRRIHIAAPVHHVHLSKGFWLGKCTVTNAQYRQYCHETGADFPKGSDQGDNHPVVNVTWTEAAAYCKHYGLSLPTEAQWEYAARGPEGREYPWGNEWDAKKCCNKSNQGPGGKTFPVGSFPEAASWCAALDMAGNVWQWCKDWYSDGYRPSAPDTDPPGPGSGDVRVLRGGSWADDAWYCQSACRVGYVPSGRYGDRFGLRCLRTP